MLIREMKSTYTVLIVDDDEEIKKIVSKFLTAEGHTCETASDGDEALDKAGKSDFDVVISDIKLPGIDGIVLTRELLKQHPGLQVMVMTGFADEYSEEEAIRAGAHDFIRKPFSLTELSSRFHKMMRDHREIVKLKDLAYFDVLTGLPNRKLFFDRLTQCLELAKRYPHLFAVLFMDLDRFKEVNDTHGHDVGDLLLKEVALRLADCIRKSDTVARMGGDEFTIILPFITGEREAASIAQRVIESLSEPFTLNSITCSIGVSIGISLYPANGEEVDALFKKADVAMYMAKGIGRSNYRFYRE